MDTFFEYTEKEVEYLSKKDKKMASLVQKLGILHRRVNHDVFSSLVFSIIGQQISMSAHRSVWKRFVEKMGVVTPSNLSNRSIDEIQSCGTSRKKAIYIKGIAESFANGSIDAEQMKCLADDELCSYLTKLKGVGKWTAEMLMIFSLERKNIFSYGDVSIHRGLRMLYGHKDISPERFEKYRKRFSPYCTIASFYLWEIAGGALPEYKDPIQSRGSRND